MSFTHTTGVHKMDSISNSLGNSHISCNGVQGFTVLESVMKGLAGPVGKDSLLHSPFLRGSVKEGLCHGQAGLWVV